MNYSADGYRCNDCGIWKSISEFPQYFKHRRYDEVREQVMVCTQCRVTVTGTKGKRHTIKQPWNPSIRMKRCSVTRGCGRVRFVAKSFSLDRGKPRALCKDCERARMERWYHLEGGRDKTLDGKEAQLKRIEDATYRLKLDKLNKQRRQLNLPSLDVLPFRRAKDRGKIEGIDD